MKESNVDLAVQEAKRAAENAGDYKSETYLAVLITGLLRNGTALGTALAGANSVPPPSSVTVAGTSEPKQYSAPELFSAKNWNTEIDKAVLAGYFLERYSGLANYTIKEIRECLVSAKVPQPNNLSLAIRQALQRAWMMEVPTGGGARRTAFALTQTGMKRVEEGMLKPEVS
jgi:hypothetical protein